MEDGKLKKKKVKLELLNYVIIIKLSNQMFTCPIGAVCV